MENKPAARRSDRCASLSSCHNMCLCIYAAHAKARRSCSVCKRNNYVLVCVTGDNAASGLGQWEVVAQLGEGGYAEVYEVRDFSTADSPRVRPPFRCLSMLMGTLGPHCTDIDTGQPSLSSVPMQYALKIDSLKVKKEPRLATVRAETEVTQIVW